MMLRLFASLLLGGAAVFFSGCSESSTAQVVTESAMLEDLKRALQEYASKKNGAAPAKKADLDPFEPNNPGAIHALSSGKCVYFWGAKLGGGAEIIAYEKEAPNTGGSVLLADGTVKKLTAAEFASAPKAGK